jgi:hypothetical protein
MDEAPPAIISSDLWIKVIEMLQQNWAVIEPGRPDGVRVYFIDDGGGVFDELTFPSRDAAAKALILNGFERYALSPDLRRLAAPPSPPFRWRDHPNGRIYSSGRFWRS